MTPPTDLPDPPKPWHEQRPAAMLPHRDPNRQVGDDSRTYDNVRLQAQAAGILLQLEPGTSLWLPDVAENVLPESTHPLAQVPGFRPVRAVAATNTRGHAVLLTHGTETDGRAYYLQPNGSWRREYDARLVDELTALTLPDPARLADPNPTPQLLHDLDDRLDALQPRPGMVELPPYRLANFQRKFWPSAQSRPQAFYNLNPRHASSRLDALVSRAIAAQDAVPRLSKVAAAAAAGSGVAYLYPPSGWVTLAVGAAAAGRLAILNYLEARRAGREIDGFRNPALPHRAPRAQPLEPPKQKPNQR
ncbi:MAG: hypothetical protein ACRDQZ_05465 [Mycobacteriales bacterium]